MYRKTTIACFSGIFMQALITNLTAILFVPLREIYGLDFVQLGILVLVNFLAQVTADLFLSKYIDRLPFRPLIFTACGLVFLGLTLFACAPWLMPGNFFGGALVATVISSFASGMCEVLLSPIINNIPQEEKGKGKAAAMALMHSFYAWGQVVTIIITTLALFFIGRTHWQFIVLFWLIVPVLCFALFFKAPLPPPAPEQSCDRANNVLFHPFYLVCMVAILFGASTEVVMNQWISTFAEVGLGMNKVIGDLFGMCLYAVWMGVGRLFFGLFGKGVNIRSVTMFGALFAVVCYAGASLIPIPWISLTFAALCGLFTSLLWPGSLVIATDRFPTSGAWLFAVLAIAGDVGAAIGPCLTGYVSDLTAGAGVGMSLRYGLLASAVFPIIAFGCFIYLKKRGDAEIMPKLLTEKNRRKY